MHNNLKHINDFFVNFLYNDQTFISIIMILIIP